MFGARLERRACAYQTQAIAEFTFDLRATNLPELALMLIEERAMAATTVSV